MATRKNAPAPKESAPNAILVQCPQCQQPGFLNAWPRITSTLDAHATELLLTGKLFKYFCPVCGKATTMVYDCVYHDVEHNTYLLYSTSPKSDENALRYINEIISLEIASGNEKAKQAQVRLVLHAFEFCEKARVLADGYDDRAIELMKVAIKRGMLEDPNCEISPTDIFLYERTIPETRGVSFIVMGENPGDTVGVPQGYDYCKRYLEERLDLIEGELKFDADWANKFLE